MWRSRSTRSACALPARSSRQERRRARRQRQRTRANWSRRGAISSGVFGGSLELIVQVLRRFVPDMQDLFQLERQLGEGDVQGSAATLHTIKGSASTVGASALAGRASELEQALRRADPLRGMEILAGIRLDELRTPCAMPACSACRRCSATCRRSRRAEPRRGGQSRQGFRRTRGSPASAAACRANNAMGVIRRYS